VNLADQCYPENPVNLGHLVVLVYLELLERLAHPEHHHPHHLNPEQVVLSKMMWKKEHHLYF
jgi:hypothetical protein